MRALPQHETDAFWMRRAVEEARAGQRRGEWPFGAVVVRMDPDNPTRHGVEVSAAYSSERCTGNPAGHAELHAIERAGLKHGRLLRGCTLYTTHEPCVMCSGLILQAKLERVAVGTLRAHRPDLFRLRSLGFMEIVADGNPAFPVDVRVNVLGSECLALFDGLVDDVAA